MSYMSSQSSGRNASVLNFIITIVLAVSFFVYISLTAYTKDAMWFYPVFNGAPTFGIIRCYGEEAPLKQDSAHLQTIAGLVNGQISGDKRWDELNLTNETYLDYQTNKNMMILELYYDEPQRVHSQSPFFSGFDTLLIPLDGRHSNTNILFNLVRGRPGGGSFHVETFAPVISYIGSNDLCKLK